MLVSAITTPKTRSTGCYFTFAAQKKTMGPTTMPRSKHSKHETFIKAIPAIRGSGVLNAGADMVHPFQPMIFLPGITGDHSWKQHP
jgi:hypothetical protein